MLAKRLKETKRKVSTQPSHNLIKEKVTHDGITYAHGDVTCGGRMSWKTCFIFYELKTRLHSLLKTLLKEQVMHSTMAFHRFAYCAGAVTGMVSPRLSRLVLQCRG